jgi:hypothetical protein
LKKHHNELDRTGVIFLIFLFHFEASFEARLSVSSTHVTYFHQQKGDLMKIKLSNLFLFTQKINRQHVQVAFAILALVLFVLGAGAPDSGGGLPR